jgi:hypothetical protein
MGRKEQKEREWKIPNNLLICLLVEYTPCAVENSRIIQSYDSTVWAGFEMNARSVSAIEVTASEIIPYNLDIHAEFIRDTL